MASLQFEYVAGKVCSFSTRGWPCNFWSRLFIIKKLSVEIFYRCSSYDSAWRYIFIMFVREIIWLIRMMLWNGLKLRPWEKRVSLLVYDIMHTYLGLMVMAGVFFLLLVRTRRPFNGRVRDRIIVGGNQGPADKLCQNHLPCSYIWSLWDVKEPTHYSKRAGHEVPGVVAGLCESFGLGGYWKKGYASHGT